MKPPFEILDHPSDLGIEARGETVEMVFRNAALGLMSVITEPSTVQPVDRRSIDIRARDRENLLVRWLTEILFLYDAERFLMADATVDLIQETTLKATILGQKYSPSIHELKLDVKAITYHQLTVEKIDDLWIARVFVDI